MQKMGIPCAYILGYATGGYHAWNVVYLHGEYYSMDVTWDDPIGNPPTQYYYTYFNITDSQMGVNHQRQAPSTSLPWAYGTACSYQNAFGGNVYGTDFYGIDSTAPPFYEDYEDDSSPHEDNTGDVTPSAGDYDFDEEDFSEDFSEDYTEDYTEDFTEDSDENWWNLLDSSWTKSDWTYEDELWQIWDEETQCMYFYDQESGEFACMEAWDETIYVLDFDSGEWVPLE